MLGTAEIAAVADGLAIMAPRWVVLDPVMVAKSGDHCWPTTPSTRCATRSAAASLITPNLPEAGVLLGEPAATTRREMGAGGRAPAGPGCPRRAAEGRPPRRLPRAPTSC